MKITLFSTFFMLAAFFAFGQPADYFQQEVNYVIDVTLDDEKHSITGTAQIEYINRSPNALPFLFFHLWGNAYQDINTAFTRQKLRTGSTRFYFSEEKDRGGYTDIDFKIDEQSLSWETAKENPDIAKVTLSEPLESGAKIMLQIPFTLKIPASFSRLGHVKESYQMTQWYPKPAVYDKDGWHPMPYLDMGEFYSEFGSFDVSITLPENYVVASTGTLQTESEIAFLQEKTEATEVQIETGFSEDTDFPASSEKMKTIRYTADQVHDFAWFADKRFWVQKGEASLLSGKVIDTWIFYTNKEADLWKDAVGYVNRSVQFYSDLVGEYPWPQATAVQSALSAGGGMEYPMITVIGKMGNAQALDGVITHEVGHNWFYGILASNERDHPWMDEGMNSYYDHRYTTSFYDHGSIIGMPDFLMKSTDMRMEELAMLMQVRKHRDQAPETHSDMFSNINYFIGAYEKPAVVLHHLEGYLGTIEFDRLMKGYYEKWKFKHPGPDDFREHVEQESGKSLSWLFDDFFYSNRKMDYALTDLENGENFNISVFNKGKVSAPFPITAYKNGEAVQTEWYEGFEGKRVVEFPKGDYDKFVLDAKKITPDYYRQNNDLKVNGLFKTYTPRRLVFPVGMEHANRHNIYLAPAMGWNNYDKFMLGLAISNTTIPSRKFEYHLAPMYGFNSGDLTGLGRLQYHYYPEKIYERMTVGLTIKSFNYNENKKNDYHEQYLRMSGFVKIDFKKQPTSTVFQSLIYRNSIISKKEAEFDQNGNFTGLDFNSSIIGEAFYLLENRRALNPFSLKIAAEQQSYETITGDQSYIKATAEYKASYTYNRGKSVDFRIFAGGFLKNTKRGGGGIFPGALSMTQEGSHDYRYDDFFFGRSDQEGFWTKQVSIADGGFKNAFGSAYTVGRSNSFLIALNMKADLPQNFPLKLPIKPYFDIGYFDNAQPIAQDDTFSDQLLWSGGFMLDFADGIFGIYFPLVNSDNLNMQYDAAFGGSYWNRVTFSLDLKKLDPWEMIDRISF